MKKKTLAVNRYHSSLVLQLSNQWSVQVSFKAANIFHVVYYQGPYPSHQPSILKNNVVDTGGDRTIATGNLDTKKVIPFIENLPLQHFQVQSQKDGYLLQTKTLTLKITTTGQITCFTEPKHQLLFTQLPPQQQCDHLQAAIKVNDAAPHYFGGGMQNGHYDQTGRILKIENLNDWLERGITSPVPFVWSTAGFGIVNNTYSKGYYDLQQPQTMIVNFVDDKLDTYYLLGKNPQEILQSYFQLTGLPLLLPKFAWYPAHLNAYNRDIWVEVTANSAGARLFEDGKYYKEYQPVNSKSFNEQRAGQIQIGQQNLVPAVRGNGEVNFIRDSQGQLNWKKESLNGEKDNYQFSARQIIERYRQHQMPLGWFIPNDGYGAGYGQTQSLDQNIFNLKQFSQFASQYGVKTGLWTQENLHPQNPLHPTADERDLQKEVDQAQIAAVKTDVAWVGSGYQAGINALYDTIFYLRKYGHNQRPLVLTVDGWAGTQKYAAVWTGDQAGGTWENIGYQIPTYLSSSLSGLANVGSDIDGIYGGGHPIIQTRDLQWKSFTPLQLNMDGWGTENKTPFTFGGRYERINRCYLKLKSQLLPYFYTAAYQNTFAGKPLLRPAAYTDNLHLTKTPDLNHEFLIGDNLLVAPIYQNTNMDVHGNDIRNGIYLPGEKDLWQDYFTGQTYQGGQVLNNFAAPLWKTPVFVKQGAIIPENNLNNNPQEINEQLRILRFYPGKQKTQTDIYDDDGVSEDYLQGNGVHTVVSCQQKDNQIMIKIQPTTGNYQGFNPYKQTLLKVQLAQAPQQIFVNSKLLATTNYQYSQEILPAFVELQPNVTVNLGNFLTIKIARQDVTQTALDIVIMS